MWWNLLRVDPNFIASFRESVFPGGSGHACEVETSVYLHLAGDKVQWTRPRTTSSGTTARARIPLPGAMPSEGAQSATGGVGQHFLRTEYSDNPRWQRRKRQAHGGSGHAPDSVRGRIPEPAVASARGSPLDATYLPVTGCLRIGERADGGSTHPDHDIGTVTLRQGDLQNEPKGGQKMRVLIIWGSGAMGGSISRGCLLGAGYAVGSYGRNSPLVEGVESSRAM